MTSLDVVASGRDELDAKIARAEDAFAHGDLLAALRLLTECAAHPAASSEQRAIVLNDLAVLAAAEGRATDAESLLLEALAHDPDHVPALENLAACNAAEGDLVGTSHWRRRACEAAPGDADAWRRLAGTLTERRRHDEAASALDRAGDGRAARAREPRLDQANGNESAPRHEIRRALIVVDWFHPSVGGSERLAEAAGVALQAEGIAVDVATRPLEHRTSREHRGMGIHEVHGDPVASLHALTQAGDYDAILAFSAPTVWPVPAALQLPRPRPRIVVVPCINAENSAQLRAAPELLQRYAALLTEADAVGYSSRSGYDVRLCEDLGIHGVYVPNAVERIARPAPRPSAGAEVPTLLMVANLWPEKNHAGLLRALRDHPGAWRLAIIGDASPEVPHLAEQVRQLAEGDRRVELLGPAPADAVAAAMDAADILLLPSLAEATPLVVLEAMSRGLPWIATPTCGAVHDHAGGLILPLRLFGEGIDFLLSDPAAAADLGTAGRLHWEACYTWDVIGPRYADILRGVPVNDFKPPASAGTLTEAVRARFYDARPGSARA